MRSLLRAVVLTFCLWGPSYVGAIPTKDCAYNVKETIDVPHGWVKHSEAPADHRIVLKIGLPQPNFHVLEKHLYEVSDPDHERYGQHLSKEEVEELIAPHPESLDLVNEWLSGFGITEDELVRSPAKDWITIRVPVSLVEKMLDTVRIYTEFFCAVIPDAYFFQKYHVWQHKASGDYLVRTTSYSLPSNLHDHVDVIQPTTLFGRFQKEKSAIFDVVSVKDSIVQASKNEPAISLSSGVTVDPSCNQTITVKCLQQLYNAVGFTPSAKGNTIGITGYLGQIANFQDLQTFFSQQVPAAVNSSFKVVTINGGTNNQSLAAAGDEADLDVEFAFGISHPIPVRALRVLICISPDVGHRARSSRRAVRLHLFQTTIPLQTPTSKQHLELN